MLKRIAVILLGIYLLYNCGGVKPQPGWTASQYFKYAMEIFNDEDYFKAANEFTVIVLRYPGSSVADSAQFFLGECHYNMDEYIIAAAEYEKLINYMSNSPLVPMAQYKMAESYYELSPRPSLDQEYTEKAIREYQAFIEENPSHELREDAERKMLEMRSKLAEKTWKSGEIYRKMRKFRAAIIYFDMVLDKYYDTEWADKAMFGKIETYLDSGDNTSAQLECHKLLEQFPTSTHREEVEEILKTFEETESQAAQNG